jgi:Lon protease-like protein
LTSERITLFPLQLVLFPHGAVPLHIFEPRYKELMRRCIDGESEFGIVLEQDGGLAKIGCTAQVVEITQEYEDGRMDIAVEGRRIFEIVELFQDKPCLEAMARIVTDEPDPKTIAAPEEVMAAYEKCHELLYGSTPDEIDREEHPSLAYAIAEDLPLDLDDKQTLLGLRDENERLAQLLPMIQQLVPRAQTRQRMRQKAGGNGHAKV